MAKLTYATLMPLDGYTEDEHALSSSVMPNRSWTSAAYASSLGASESGCHS